MKKELIFKELENINNRSAWGNGVINYAFDLLESVDGDELPDSTKEITNLLLNGADSWKAYSYGGCALVYDGDIARRLCTPSELKRIQNGEKKPNRCETWLDVQTRALYQAYQKILDIVHSHLATNIL